MIFILISIGFFFWLIAYELKNSYEEGRQAGMREAWEISFDLSKEFSDDQKYSEATALLAACNKISFRRKQYYR